MPASRFSEARASVLIDDLLAGFNSKAVQKKLERDVCTADSGRHCQSPLKYHVQGMDDLKDEVHTASDAVPKISSKLDAACMLVKLKGAENDENMPSLPEASRLKPTIQRMAYAGVNEQISKKLESQAAKKPDLVTVNAGHGTYLSKTSALSLQQQLLEAFTAPAFQKQLHQLVRLHNATVTKSAEYHSAFRKLVRSVQIPIIERYGFKASEQGVVDLLRTFEQLGEDADIFVNSEAIKEALFSPSTPPASVEPQELEAGEKPSTKEQILILLRTLHELYSQPEFQAGISSLKFLETDDRYSAGGYYHLPGRAEYAMPIQEGVLPLHGFEASKDGVHEMISLCATYLGDRDVASMFDAINSKLGMSPAACQRFRKLAAFGLAGVKPSPPLPETQCCALRTCGLVQPVR